MIFPFDCLGLENSTKEKAVNDIPLTKKQQKGEEEEHINIPTYKLRDSSLGSSNVSNDTDKSLENCSAETSDDVQQTIFSSVINNNKPCARRDANYDESNENRDVTQTRSNNKQTVTQVSPNSSCPKVVNIYRSRENLSDLELDETESENYEMENSGLNKGVNAQGNDMDPRSKTPPPTDEELQDFLEYMGNGVVTDGRIGYDPEQLRKRTAAELGMQDYLL